MLLLRYGDGRSQPLVGVALMLCILGVFGCCVLACVGVLLIGAL